MCQSERNHTRKSSEYTDVQNGFDYLSKLIRFAWKGYRFQVHVNGQSKTGYTLALAAASSVGLPVQPVALSWRVACNRNTFPGPKIACRGGPFQLLFHLSGRISCNNIQVKQAIERYGLDLIAWWQFPAFPGSMLISNQSRLPPTLRLSFRSAIQSFSATFLSPGISTSRATDACSVSADAIRMQDSFGLASHQRNCLPPGISWVVGPARNVKACSFGESCPR